MGGMGLKWRIIMPIGVILALGIGAIVVYVGVRYSRTTTELSQSRLGSMTREYANGTKAMLDAAFGSARTLASGLGAIGESRRPDRELAFDLIRRTLADNGELYSLWAGFEPNAFDGKDAEYADRKPQHDASGRFVPSYYRDGSAIEVAFLEGYDKSGDGDYYLVAKERGRESISAPYQYDFGGKLATLASVSVPILGDGKVVGVAGTDLDLSELSAAIAAIRLYDSGYAILVDHSGNIVCHPDAGTLMQPVDKHVGSVVAAIVRDASGADVTRLAEDVSRSDGAATTAVVSSFEVAGTGQFWRMLVLVPTGEVLAEVRSGILAIGVAGIVFILFSLAVLYLIVSRVAGVLTEINLGTDSASAEVSGASRSINDASTALAEATSSLSSSIEEISASLEEMNSVVRQTADHADASKQMTESNGKSIADGSAAILEMTGAMEEINDSAAKINVIVKTIQEISFQTNLLALNAAVEASRAGEAGKGFAVVADEVRSLAQRSAASANETTALIGLTVDRIRKGTEVAAKLSGYFGNIELGSKRIDTLTSEIAQATNEQVTGVDHINSAVAELDRVAQQVAANADSSAETAKRLHDQAESLDGMIGRMRTLIVGGGKGGGAALAALAPAAGRKLAVKPKPKQLPYSR